MPIRRIKRVRGKEISPVVLGAQGGAGTRMIKSRSNHDEIEIQKIDTIATSIENGHQHVVSVSVYNGALELNVRYATEDGVYDEHRHDVYRDSEGNILLSMEDGHTHTISEDAINNVLATAMTKSEAKSLLENLPVIDSSNVSKDNNNDEDNMSQTHDEIIKRLEALEAENTQLKNDKKVDSFDEATKSYFDGLKTDEEKADFLAKSAEEMKDIVEKATEKTEEVKADPITEKLLERIEALEADNAELKAEKAEGNLLKKANDLKIVGTDEEKIETMKALDSIKDDATREKVLKNIGSAGLAKAFSKVSKSDESEDDIEIGSRDEAKAFVEKKVKYFMDEAKKEGKPISRGEATKKVREVEPDVYKFAQGYSI